MSVVPSPRLLRRKGGKRCSDLLESVPHFSASDKRFYLPDAWDETVANSLGVLLIAWELLAQHTVLKRSTGDESEHRDDRRDERPH